MTSQPIYYVYILIDPRNNQPFYVGKGQGDRVTRHYYNWASLDKDNAYKSRIIRKLKSLGFSPCYEIAASGFTRSADAGEYEKLLISYYGRVGYDPGGVLTNVAAGGEGCPHGHKKVDQYNLFGEFICTFESLLEAARACGSEYSTQIIDCCKKQRNTRGAFGFFWTYHKEPLDSSWCWNKKRPVYQWTLDGVFVNRFHNISHATRQTGFLQNGSEIGKSCRANGIIPCKQFLWTYGTQPQQLAPKTTKRIQCVETDLKFDSVRAAAGWLSTVAATNTNSHAAIRAVADGRVKSYRGFTFKWV